jgi:hypothetical protein
VLPGVTPDDLAAAMQRQSVDWAAASLVLRLAGGLVVEVFGERATAAEYPATVNAVVLRVAARAYANPEGLERHQVGSELRVPGAAEAGVWLSERDRADLQRALAVEAAAGAVARGAARGSFPAVVAWPDPI